MNLIGLTALVVVGTRDPFTLPVKPLWLKEAVSRAPRRHLHGRHVTGGA